MKDQSSEKVLWLELSDCCSQFFLAHAEFSQLAAVISVCRRFCRQLIRRKCHFRVGKAHTPVSAHEAILGKTQLQRLFTSQQLQRSISSSVRRKGGC